MSARATHTPGPWHIGTSCDHTPAVMVAVPEREGSGFVLAHINRIPRMAAFGGTPEANALLIAAAPDMLAALKQTLEDIQIYHEETGKGEDVLAAETFAAARAAIAKASGAVQ